MNDTRAITQFDAMRLVLRSRFPRARLVAMEDSRLMRLLSRLAFWRPDFLAHTTLTLGYRIYMPRRLFDTNAGYRILRHEAVHLAQRARLGPIFYLAYLLCLPSVLTLRALFEFEAYVETMRVEYEETGRIKVFTIERIVEQFTGPSYLWMWPFPAHIRQALERAAYRIQQETPPHLAGWV